MAVNLQWIRNQLIQALTTILRQLNVENLENDRLDSLQFRVDWIYGLVVRYQGLDVLDDRVVACVREARDCIHRSVIQCLGTLCQAGLIFNGERGRPRFEIPRAQLEFLVEKGFKVAEIAQLFVTSPSTVERRLAELRLSIRTTYAQLSDSDLDVAVTEIMREVPNVGCKRMTGLLLGRGLRVQQARIRESMRRVNPESVLLRALELNVMRRRSYIDGNHKLIRYAQYQLAIGFM